MTVPSAIYCLLMYCNVPRPIPADAAAAALCCWAGACLMTSAKLQLLFLGLPSHTAFVARSFGSMLVNRRCSLGM
jgi:hypothetical protein